MPTRNHTISQLQLKPKMYSELVGEIISSHIRSYARQSHREWELNHGAVSPEWEEKVAELKDLKAALKQEIASQPEDQLLNIEFSIKIKNADGRETENHLVSEAAFK